jgi:multimeric flavodoxin WrbA
METSKVKIVGISGTPIKDGNCDKLVQAALAAAGEIEGIETEFITLADKEIGACSHCQWCIENRARCKVKDDVHAVHDKMFEADGLILGGPTYNQVLSTQLLNIFNRGREEIFFSHRLANKGIPGSAVTLGWFGFGMESAQFIINQLMGSWGVFPVGAGSAISSTAWQGLRSEYQPNGVLDDLRGVFLVQEMCGRRLAKIAKMMKYARDAGLSAAYGTPEKEK